MGVLRYKIWYDLWENRDRTLQVVLIVGMGAFAVGMIISLRMLIIPGMEDIWQEASPAMVYLWTNPGIDDNTIKALQRIEGLEDVEGYVFTSIEWRLGPDDEWAPAFLKARDDYEDQRYTTVGLLSGEWPRGNILAMSQGVDVATGLQEGDQVFIRIGEREEVVEIGGIIYDPIAQPPNFFGPVQFLATRKRLGQLTGDQGFNRILAGAAEYDEAVLTDLANQIQNKLEKQGVDSGGNGLGFTPGRVFDPNIHFFQNTMDAIFFIMGIMSFLGLILALFLVYNTINAIINQQVRQIGVMKAIGASTGQILALYLLTVIVYGLLALIIAVPLGAFGGWGLYRFLMNVFNAEPEPFTFVFEAVLAQVAIALLTPLFVSLIPIFSGARITVREAINTYGLRIANSWLDRLIARIQFIPRLISLTINNTFRNKGRVFLTQITLVLSGLIFMMVLSVRDSTVYTFSDVLFSIYNYNVFFDFKGLERIEEVETLTLAYPGVKAVEMWRGSSAEIRVVDQSESEDDLSVSISGVPLPTILYIPQVQEGRWLLPADGHAAVLNMELAQDVGVGVGDWVTLDLGVSGESNWQVVGLLFDPGDTNSVHVSRDVLAQELGSVGKAGSVYIQTIQSDPASEVAIAKELRQYYEGRQLDVVPGVFFTASERTASVLNIFGIIISLLAAMAVVIGLMGSMALSGVLSLGVLERRREIGVLRAIGASSGSIARLIVGEGLILGWMSWLIAIPLSVLAGQLMTQGVGQAFGIEILYKYTLAGAIYWLSIITILSILASLLPARGAMRISVRESLAYDG